MCLLCIFVCSAYTKAITLPLPSLVDNLHSAFPDGHSRSIWAVLISPLRLLEHGYRMLHRGVRPSFAPPFQWCWTLRFPFFHYYNQCCNNHVINSLFMPFANLLETLWKLICVSSLLYLQWVIIPVCLSPFQVVICLMGLFFQNIILHKMATLSLPQTISFIFLTHTQKLFCFCLPFVLYSAIVE